MTTFKTRFSVGQEVFYFHKYIMKIQKEIVADILIRSGRINHIQYFFESDYKLFEKDSYKLGWIGKSHDGNDEGQLFETLEEAKASLRKLLEPVL